MFFLLNLLAACALQDSSEERVGEEINTERQSEKTEVDGTGQVADVDDSSLQNGVFREGYTFGFESAKAGGVGILPQPSPWITSDDNRHQSWMSGYTQGQADYVREIQQKP